MEYQYDKLSYGVVVIGRNEAKRLLRCLESISLYTQKIVYVDSGSVDDSTEIAKSMDIDVIELDPSTPFSAARARNEGFSYLIKLNPSLIFVQFIDGDCTLSDNWLEFASQILFANNDYGAVVGHLQELHPNASIYNRLCALEWRSNPIGDVTNNAGLGGISMVNVELFSKLGGFNPKVIAGEEPELAVRMALAGYKIIKLNHSMAIHDADMHDFSQWWKRSVRNGHAIGQRSFLNGNTYLRDCVRERNSALFWGLAFPLAILILFFTVDAKSLWLLIGYPFLGFKVYRYCLSRGNYHLDSMLYSIFLLIGKFAEAIGLMRFYKNKLGDQYKIIEYK